MRLRASPTDREIAALAFPAIGALAADPLLSLVDTALVGHLGAVPLAALGINLAVFTTVFWVFNFLMYGTTAEVAHHRGRGDERAAARHAVQALWLAVGLGVTVMVLLQTLAPVILGLMGAAGEIREPALAYLRIRAFAAVSVLIVMVGHGTFRGLKNTKTPLVIAVAANAVNAVLSYVFIYPVGLGVAGAAWGTLIAQTGAAAVFLTLGNRALAVERYRFDPAAMASIVKISRDLFLRTLSLLSGLMIATAVAARMGVEVVAGHQVVREVWSLLALVLDGFAIAGQAMIGTSLGASRFDVARFEARRLVVWGVGMGAVTGAVIWLLRDFAPRIFTTDAAVLAEIDAVWWLIAILQPIAGIVFVLDGVLMGAKDFRFLLWSTALASLGGLVPVAFLSLAFGWGLTGVWYGMVVLMVVRVVATLLRLRSAGWTRTPVPT